MRKVIISLGGIVIVPNKVNYSYLKQFKKLILKFSKKNKVIIVCGGGHTAREYIDSLKGKFDKKVYGLIGVAATRLNARLVDGVFNREEKIPETVKEVKNKLKKHNLVICGALEYHSNMTTDGNAAELASALKADIINITNVKGLYNKDPKKYKNAKLIKNINFKDFNKMISKIKFHAGQHFVLDQSASKMIMKNKIKVYIVDSNLKNLKKCLYGKSFVGTIIS